ncbi:PDZ domain-containing protein 4 [Ditylenchus destructor]|uniref:PDZ domain-containing protein 4 n=1 Tax=Ditylenchus destructor TaxID=166010 RepID=A0AAD4N1W8_9BILA|nr:PDZ domain-containing protein 4 [Ditylenchus destructor]
MAPPNVTVTPLILHFPENEQQVRTVTVKNNDMPVSHNEGEADKVCCRISNVPDTHAFSEDDLNVFINLNESYEINISRLAMAFPLGNEDRIPLEFIRSGKFWSREERKRHLERAKERKQRHNRILNEREQANSTDKEILQLSQRKQQRKNSRQLFDRFTTIQEFLAHGVRDPATHPVGGILSVTTV